MQTLLQATCDERLSLLNGFYTKFDFPENLRQVCLEQYCSLPPEISHDSIAIALTLLSDQQSISANDFLKILKSLRLFAPFFFNKKEQTEIILYQHSYHLELPEANVILIQNLLELGIYPQESYMGAICQTRQIEPGDVEDLLEFFKKKRAQDINFQLYAQILIRFIAVLFNSKIAFHKDIVRFLQKYSTESCYADNLNALCAWVEQLDLLGSPDELLAFNKVLSSKSRYYFNALTRLQISFSAQDLAIVIDAENSSLPLVNKILKLKRAGLAIYPFDIKNYLVQLQRRELFFLETKLLPIFSRHHLNPSLKDLSQLLFPVLTKIDISQQLESYFSIHSQYMGGFNGVYWSTFCECLAYEVAYTPALSNLLYQFDKISDMLISFIRAQQNLGYAPELTISILLEHQRKLLEISSLREGGYLFNEFELLEILQTQDDSTEGLRVIAQIKKLATLETTAPFIKEWLSDLSHAKKILQLIQDGFEFSHELNGIVKTAGLYASELTELLILFKNKYGELDFRYIQILYAAQQNSFFLLKGMLRCELSLEQVTNSVLQKTYLQGFCRHYDITDSKKFTTKFLDKAFESPSVELSTTDSTVYEQAFSLLKDYGLSSLQKVALAVLTHHNPVMLAKACGILHAEGLLSSTTLIMLKDAEKPEPLATGFVECRRAGVEPNEDEISILLTQDTSELSVYMAEALVFFHQNFPDAKLTTEELNSLCQSESEAIYLVRGWLVAAQHPEQQFDTEDDDFMIELGLFYLSSIDIALIPQLIINIDSNHQLREAVIELQKVKITLTQERYDALERASQNDAEPDTEFFSGASAIDDTLCLIVSELQKEWLQPQYAAIEAALRASAEYAPLFPEIQSLTARYATEALFQRGDIYIVREHIQLLLKFLVENPYYVSLFENIASVYNSGCVNQSVQGLLEISSWIFVAQQSTACLKIKALDYRYALELITSFVEEHPELGERVKAEAANALLVEIEHCLRLIKHKPTLWPNILQKIAYSELIADFMESDAVRDFINQMVSELKNMRDEDLIDYVLSEARSYHLLWGAIMFPDQIKAIEKLFKNKKAELSHITYIKADFELSYDALSRRTVSQEEKALIEQTKCMPFAEILNILSRELSTRERSLYEEVVAIHQDYAKSLSECDSMVYSLKTVAELHKELNGLEEMKFSLIVEEIAEKTHEFFRKDDSVNIVLFSQYATGVHVCKKRP